MNLHRYQCLSALVECNEESVIDNEKNILKLYRQLLN